MSRRAALATVDGRLRRRAAGVALGLVAALFAAGCSQPDPPEPEEPASSSPPQAPVQLTFGFYGNDQEVAALASMVEDYNRSGQGSRVRVRSWPDRLAAARDLRANPAGLPDAFLVSWRDLAWLLSQQLIQPVDELMDARGVEFGDDYSRDALIAFSADNSLACMPYGISPMVVYYNTDLVAFNRMRRRGLDAPDPGTVNWSFEQFAAAARFATRPGRGTRGVHIEPTLAGLAPFVYSGGGQLFDDPDAPTSLAFSADDTRAALEAVLPLLRDPLVTLSPEQLARAPALEWFKRGRLGMLPGFRDLVPQLRAAPGLRFDVKPMPVIEEASTVGDVTGICMSADTASVEEAADFIVHATSARSVGRVARAGYLVPANLEVAESEVFLQPGREPANAGVFNTSVRNIVIPPLLGNAGALEQAVAPALRQLLTDPVLPDLVGLTVRIDAASRRVLAPEQPSATAEPTPSG